MSSRIVLDTNVWISGLIFGGNAGKILEIFSVGEISVVVSEELLSELRRKILQKFPLFTPKLSLLEASIRKDASMVRLGRFAVEVCWDADDNRVLETAILGGCDYIISGDKDLLLLGSYQGVEIVTPREFLERQ